MKIVLFSMMLIGSQLATPVSDSIPKLNVEATCKATVATARDTFIKAAVEVGIFVQARD